jgi:7-cyano-7-deazaguanine synthase in queuosine biosynthesis
MIWNIVPHIGDNDSFTPTSREDERRLEIDIDGTNSGRAVRYNVKDVVQATGLVPPSTAVDLLHVALTVFSADRGVRRAEAYNRWERGFQVYIPVSDPHYWERVRPTLEEMLTFLTNDYWTFEFRQLDSGLLIPHNRTALPLNSDFSTVALLSGGLDSFVGAIDALECELKSVAFVSHHNTGSVANKVQDRVFKCLDTHYPNRAVPFRFFVQPPKGLGNEAELSSRSRSFLFLSLAVMVASGAGIQMPVIIPENGFMSLNVPLAPNRIGSLSTRTTHPYFLSLFQQCLTLLDIPVRIENPYRFMTKGEMLSNCHNADVVQEGLERTHSCSNAAQHRFAGISPYTHCGYCLPCLARRAATHFSQFKDATYHIDVLTNPHGDDLPALRRRIFRSRQSNSPLIFEVLKAGPLPDSQAEYADVYGRGLTEIAHFLGITEDKND